MAVAGGRVGEQHCQDCSALHMLLYTCLTLMKRKKGMVVRVGDSVRCFWNMLRAMGTSNLHG